MPNLMMIGLTVQKLLTFLFSIGNALKWPKIGVFGPLRGENFKVKLFNPQKAHVYTIPRHLSHFGRESVHAFDQDAFPRNKKKHARPWFRDISSPPGEAPADPIRTKFGTFVRLPEPVDNANFQLIRLRNERVRPC
jgi:hypothetical protein